MNNLKGTMSAFASRTKALITALTSGIVFAAFVFGGPARFVAQTKPAMAQAAAQKPNEQESRGEGLFLQRCSLCHLPRKLKFGSPPVVGPNLTGLFKEADADQQKFLRGFILKGDPKMPGFQYGLEANEVDDLIAYLKTL